MNIRQNISLKNFNSFQIDASAEYFTAFKNLPGLEESLQFARQSRSMPTLVLGGGSNILLTRNFNGLVLKNEVQGIEKVGEDEHYVYVKAGAGEPWHGFVQYCISNNLAGVENLSLIPGNVGASPMQNIGAYGVEIKDVFHSLKAYHIHDKTMVTLNAADCEFGYRESVFKNKFKNQFVIMQVTYRLRKQPVFNIDYGAIQQELVSMGVTELSIQAVSQAVINIRQSKLPDPKLIGNAGSFFKNPEVSAALYGELQVRFPAIVGYALTNGNVKLAAGWLIEQCGWKGYRSGDAGCHDRQALVLVNYGTATGAAILTLSEQIIASVKEKFAVSLNPEVNII
ncbi:MAG: UDP-N-acetylmuramate dehydrogenase [Chitinophagaceae bacterium]|nr:MAG: UDP-N-acetylmuramate dehydrogenase [Chitinophagaceae bacterium]